MSRLTPLLQSMRLLLAKIRAWYRQRSRWQRVFILGFTGIFLFIFIFYQMLVWDAFGPVPSYSEIENIETPEASEVIAEDGTILGKYFTENRTNVTFDEINPQLIQALIVTEDERFYQHSGVDFRSTMRVIFKTILGGDKSSGGGSTISQQLAKNLYARKNKGRFSLLFDKMREILTARRLEKVYSKEEILTLYLNTVPFGSNAFGIRTAARRYFNTTPAELSIQESATLIGMLKATTTYNPINNPERATERRNLVLQLMNQKGTISSELLDSVSQLPMEVRQYVEDHQQGNARYFREALRMELDEWLKGVEKPNGEPYNLYTDGLKIFTSVDPVMQQYADEAVADQMERLQRTFNNEWRREEPWGDHPYIQDVMKRLPEYKAGIAEGKSAAMVDSLMAIPRKMTVFTWKGASDTLMSPLDSLKYYAKLLRCGFLATDKSGFVKAWVGGVDFDYMKYDHVKARRQIGSTIKPVVYATALKQGIDPCEFRPNNYTTYPEWDDYRPGNVDGRYGGMFTFAGALNKSINVIAVEVGLKAGLKNIIQTANEMGLKGPIPEEPGLCLGAFDASLMEMVETYACIANRGKKVNVRLFKRIEDRFGNVIVDFENNPRIGDEYVLDTTVADIMLQLLKGVVERGTGANAKYTYIPYWDLAGKTGTSQEYADGWFMGFTPDLIAGAWVGGETPLVHFKSSASGQSTYTALPVWGNFFKKLEKDEENRFNDFRNSRFPIPSKEVRQALDCSAGYYDEELEVVLLDSLGNPIEPIVQDSIPIDQEN